MTVRWVMNEEKYPGVSCLFELGFYDCFWVPRRSRRTGNRGKLTRTPCEVVVCHWTPGTDTLSGWSLVGLADPFLSGPLGRLGSASSRCFHRKDNGKGEGPVANRVIRQILHTLSVNLQWSPHTLCRSNRPCVLCHFVRHRIRQGRVGRGWVEGKYYILTTQGCTRSVCRKVA